MLPFTANETQEIFTLRRYRYEENVPAEQDSPEEDPRFSRPFPHQERPRRAEPQACQGTQEISRLSWQKERRLLKRPQFLTCFERGRKLQTRHFLLFVTIREECPDHFRLGLTVSKKMGNAVARNRIKRVVREYFRLHQNEYPGPLDIVVVPKRNLKATQLNLALVESEFAPLPAQFGRLATAI